MSGRKTMNEEIKQMNRSSIYRYFLEKDALTKQDLVTDLHLCLPTVTKKVDELMADGLIEISGSKGHTGGRRAATYSLKQDARIALGIDITQNHVTIVAVNLMGTIIASSRNRKRFETTDAYYQYVGAALQGLIQQAQISTEQILGVGIGLPVLVDADCRSIIFSKIINPGDSAYEHFAKYIPYNIQLFNDANAAAFTETWTNSAAKNAFYLMLSNNIGGSMIIGGSVYSGDNQRSGEIGHVTLVPGGKPCYCGQAGCVDAYLAATNLSDLTDGNLQEFFERLQAGDEAVLQKWDEYLEHLVSTVNILRVLLDCDVVLGGYVGEYLEPYLEQLREKMVARNMFSQNAEYLKVCSYKKESIAAGAALNCIAAFISKI